MCRGLLDYYNRKGYHSMVLQALVDHQYKFMDVYTGWPGSIHDARVLMNSTLFLKCDSGAYPPNCPKDINGTSIPLFIIGDPAYPLTPWLIKPFSDKGKLTTKQKGFNYHVSRARCVVKNAFGRLKGRWRSLMKQNDLPQHVVSCTTHVKLMEMNLMSSGLYLNQHHRKSWEQHLYLCHRVTGSDTLYVNILMHCNFIM